MDPRMYPVGKTGGSGRMASVTQSAISAPSSGPTGTGAGTFAWPASLLYCTTSKTLWENEGTLASPYWTPVDALNQRGIIGWDHDFRDNVGKAHADTATAATLGYSGLKVSGQGIAETDSGLVITNSEAGRIGRITTTDEVSHTVTLSPIGTSPMFQPDTHGPFAVDADVAMVTAITLRAFFLGFCGNNADEMDPVASGSTVTVTFPATLGDDLAGIFMSAGLTDAAGLMCINVKDDAAATQLVTASGVNSGKDMPAAATYGRYRVECDAAGNVRYFFNKVQIGYTALALALTEEVSPLLQLISTSTAVKAADVKRLSAWGVRA